MGIFFRKSAKLGPIRLTASRRGLTASTGVGPLRASKSTTGRRRMTIRIPGTGISWRTSNRR